MTTMDDGDTKSPQLASTTGSETTRLPVMTEQDQHRRKSALAEHKRQNLMKIQQKIQQQRASSKREQEPQPQIQQQHDNLGPSPTAIQPFAIDPAMLLDMETAMTSMSYPASPAPETSTGTGSISDKLRHLEDVFDDEEECLDGRMDDDDVPKSPPSSSNSRLNHTSDRSSHRKSRIVMDRSHRGGRRTNRLLDLPQRFLFRPQRQETTSQGTNNSSQQPPPQDSDSSSSSTTRSKWCCGMLLCVLLILGLGVVLPCLLLFVRTMADHEKNDQRIPPAPDNIMAVCMLDHVLHNPDGARACQEICDRAHCCHHQAYENTCYRDNQEICQPYILPCGVLQLNVILGQSPPDVGATAESVQVTSSTATVFPNAMALWSDPALLQPAPAHLMQTCQAATLLRGNDLAAAETSGVALTCLETCDKAACCWKRPSDGDGVDWCGTHPNCGEYQRACSVLVSEEQEQPPGDTNGQDTLVENVASAEFATFATFATIESTTTAPAKDIPPAPIYLEHVCSAENVHTTIEALLSCQQACLPASCCWMTMMNYEKTDCQGADPICDGYRDHCTVLNKSFLAPQEAPLASKTLSTSEFSFTTPGEGLSSASNRGGHAPQYLDYPPETILDVCYNHDNAINIAQGKKTLCEQVCEAGACCFMQLDGIARTTKDTSNNNACPQDFPDDFCDKYYPCRVAFGCGMPTTEQDSDAMVLASQNPVDLACTKPTSLTQPWDITGCLEVCGEATCCFTLDPAKSCIMTQPETDCSYFEACRVLYHPQKDAVLEEDEHNRRQRQLRRGVE